MINIEDVIESSRNLKLLYVEDNQDAREMTSMILEDYFDSITVAVDGLDGLEKFKEKNIDIVITDINMPKMDGLEMCAKIREIDDEVPLIILSAHNEDSFFTQSIQTGVNGYLLKPIDIEQLTNLIFRVTQKYKYVKKAQENLHFLNAYQEAANQSSIVSKSDQNGIITYVNDAFCEISGYSREELLGKNHNIVRHPDNDSAIFEELWKTIKIEKSVWKGKIRNKAKNSKSYYVDSVVVPIINLDGEIIEYISLRHDITDIMNPVKQLNDEIKNIQNQILIFMKLDKFDMMEEFYDHDVVESIQDKAHIYLKNKFSEFYEFNSIYRLGNGEFAFLIDYAKYFNSEEEFTDSLKKYQDIIREEKIDLDDIEYDISVIISLVYENEKVLESAKLGMKQLLKTKKDFIIANNLANIELVKAKENMKTVQMIKKAIEDFKIVSYFQPIVDNNTQEIVKYESLVRLIDDEDKVISPYFFIETSKKSNYYPKITNIVMDHSFSMLRNCDVDISINLSAIDIEQKSTREKIFELLEENKEYAQRAVFELLEDESVKEFDVIRDFIVKVKSYGVKIAIDDFGAGYSNYERLLDYQPDILKIDGCLIRDIETSSYSLSAVKSIVTFAKEQNIQTVAEFIESESIFKIVKELGVDFSQGYYFGKPEPLQ